MTEQEINNLIDSKIAKTKMSQLPEATQTSGLYSIGYTGNQSVKYKANLLQGDPLTVRKTYQTEVEALADKNPIDPSTSLPLKIGQFVSIVDDGEKNGIYRISSISGDGTMSLELQGKLGDLSDYANKSIESSEYYEYMANSGKDFPIDYDASLPKTGFARESILDAKVFCDTYYRVNFAYSNRTATNTETYDNTVMFLITDSETDPTIEETISFRNDINIGIDKNGLYTRTYDIPEYRMKVQVTYDLDKMPEGNRNYGNQTSLEGYNKMPFSKLIFYRINLFSTDKTIESSEYYKFRANSEKDFPIDYDASLPKTGFARESILDAKVFCDTYYRVNFAYSNRTATNTEIHDNTVYFLITDSETDPTIEETISFRNDINIGIDKNGLYTRTYDIPKYRMKVQVTYDLDKMPKGSQQYGTSGKEGYNKMPFSKLVFHRTNLLESSEYYKFRANSEKDFPIDYDASLPKTGYLRESILDAKVFCDTYYRVNFAYSNRTATNTEIHDNTVYFLITDSETDPTIERLIAFRNDANIGIDKNGLYTRTYDIPEYRMKVQVTYDLDKMPIGAQKYGNETSLEGYNKMPFSKLVFYPTNLNANYYNLQAVKVVGENIYIGAKYDADNDIIIHFKKTMFNELMTFARVGLASNSNTTPIFDASRGTNVLLNYSGSDNIGPMAIESGGSVGGNHSYQNLEEVKTAKSLSYDFYADGIKLKDGDSLLTNNVEIRTRNIIYDPTVPPLEGETILSSELCYEDVSYSIVKGNIYVSLTHTYLKDTELSWYYGMQSMCQFENDIMTPNGEHIDFKISPTDFKKQDFPNFNRFIERDISKEKYQSTFLLPKGLGMHSNLDAEYDIFARGSTGKTYHRLMSPQPVSQNDVFYWQGIYTWFKAFRDDDNVLVYTASSPNATYLFIDAKKSFDEYIQVPTNLIGKDFEVFSKSDTIADVEDMTSIGFKIIATGAGSMVLKF